MTRRQFEVDQTGDLTPGQFTPKVILVDSEGEPLEFGGESSPVTWASITGKPTTFAPTIGTTASTALAGNTSFVPPTRTVNGKALSANVTVAGADVALTGYAAGTAGAVAATDTLNAAIAKLEARIAALESA